METMSKWIKRFFELDSSVGIMLFAATFIAIFLENSLFSSIYHYVQHFEVNVAIGELILAHDLHYWVNEGLMVLFFLLVGLEIKREFLMGQLASVQYVVLPATAALGGIVVPAAIFMAFNYGTEGLNGWAIPTATDIAFALGVIALFGKRLPHNVKLFVLTLAVIDDIGAIIIIATFYSSQIDVTMLFYSLACGLLMLGLNQMNVRSLIPYMLIGTVSWLFMLKTGLHPTLTGIIIAACIPLRIKQDPKLPHAFGLDLGEARMGYISPAIRLEAGLHSPVSFMILPLFAFMNSGLDLGGELPEGVSFLGSFFSGITGGVFWGLFVGKPLGMLLGAYVWKFLARGNFPSQIDGLCILAMGFIVGIGYTMSILISTIAFEGNELFINSALIGILCGSLLSAIAGSLLFAYWLKRKGQAA